MGQPAAEKACGICDRFGRCGRGLRSPGRDTMRSVRRLRLSLASQILVFQLAIVLGALILGAAASYLNESRQLDQRYEQRSLNIAQSVAGMPSVGDGLRDSDPSRTLQPLAEGIRKASGASFVVIAGANGIRYSHPNLSMIGKPIDEDYRTVLAGHTWVGVEHGTLGVSARGKAPIFDGQKRVIGIVSVGFLEGTLSEQLAAMLPQLAFYLLVALALGVAGSLLLARDRKSTRLNSSHLGISYAVFCLKKKKKKKCFFHSSRTS